MRVDHKLWPRHAAAAAVAGARLAGLLQRMYRGPAAGADRPARRLRRGRAMRRARSWRVAASSPQGRRPPERPASERRRDPRDSGRPVDRVGHRVHRKGTRRSRFHGDARSARNVSGSRSPCDNAPSCDRDLSHLQLDAWRRGKTSEAHLDTKYVTGLIDRQQYARMAGYAVGIRWRA